MPPRRTHRTYHLYFSYLPPLSSLLPVGVLTFSPSVGDLTIRTPTDYGAGGRSRAPASYGCLRRVRMVRSGAGDGGRREGRPTGGGRGE